MLSRWWLVAVGLALGACAQGSTATDDDDGQGGTRVGDPTAGAGGAAAHGAAGGTGAVGGAGSDCGNGVIEPGEDCDATVGSADCTTIGQGYVGGTLACLGDCSYDTTGCEAPANCNNGQLDAGEDCDGNLLGGADCGVVGHSSGELACTGGCVFDTTDCYTCGDGALHGPEVCDGTNLNNLDCTDFSHDGGTLLCAANCLSFNESSCTNCGDGTAEGTEQCDAPDMDGQDCQSQGFAGGTLGCFSNCTFNTQGCFYGQCSNGADDDGDGFTDMNDPGCTSPNDDDEGIYADSCGGLGGPIYDVTFADTSLPILVTGSTVGAPNHFGPLGMDPFSDCTGATGGEVILFYRAFTSWSPVLFTLDNPGTSYDTVLYVRQSDCANPVAEICDDDSGWIWNILSSELYPVTLPAGDYFIFVDGFGGGSGQFELTIDLNY